MRRVPCAPDGAQEDQQGSLASFCGEDKFGCGNAELGETLRQLNKNQAGS